MPKKCSKWTPLFSFLESFRFEVVFKSWHDVRCFSTNCHNLFGSLGHLSFRRVSCGLHAHSIPFPYIARSNFLCPSPKRIHGPMAYMGMIGDITFKPSDIVIITNVWLQKNGTLLAAKQASDLLQQSLVRCLTYSAHEVFMSHSWWIVLLMAEILHHLKCKKTCKYWEKLPINWCRISSINSITVKLNVSTEITVYIYIHAKFRKFSCTQWLRFSKNIPASKVT